ncbi:MAG: winged helix-turn-helix domain-containing protein [Candidatus Thorarchaeota archaeon]
MSTCSHSKTQPVVHVALLGTNSDISLESLVIRRSLDELILIHSLEEQETAFELKERFRRIHLNTTTVTVNPKDFYNTLSSILKVLDNQQFDDYTIEFSVFSENNIMTMAACVAAIILRACILSPTGDGPTGILEVSPSSMTTLTHTKKRILEYVSGYLQSVYQSDISKGTGITRSSVSRHLSDMERAGYVTRQNEGRKKFVRITDLGSVILHHKILRKRRVWGIPDSRTIKKTRILKLANIHVGV